jgi:4'-phosphopantetheinyl transferase
MAPAIVEAWLLSFAPPASRDDLVLLDAHERERHAAFLNPAAANAFAITRAALRRLLAVRQACRPEEVRLRAGAHGKPCVAGGAGPHFNVSHCDTAAVIAFSDDGPLGVDIERLDAMPGMRGIARTFLSAAELAALQREDAAEPPLRRLWCRKEAVLKAWGCGLATSPSDVDLGDPAMPAGQVMAADGLLTAWRDLDLPAGLLGAIALTTGPGAIARQGAVGNPAGRSAARQGSDVHGDAEGRQPDAGNQPPSAFPSRRIVVELQWYARPGTDAARATSA